MKLQHVTKSRSVKSTGTCRLANVIAFSKGTRRGSRHGGVTCNRAEASTNLCLSCLQEQHHKL